jgi:Peptidase M30
MTVNVSLTGLSAGKAVTVVSSNGASSTLAMPSPGTSPEPMQTQGRAVNDLAAPLHANSSMDDHTDQAHTRILESSRQLVKKLVPISNSAFAAGVAAREQKSTQPSVQYAPTLNTTKTWIDYGGAGTVPTNYSTSVQAVCTTPSGRNVVIWVDPTAITSFKASAASITAFANAYCGTTGVSGISQQITNLMGDVWGSNAARYPNDVIQDTVKQDINIVVLNVPINTGWAGYFYGLNNFLKTAGADFVYSNEALVFFINANQLQASLNFTLSTLLHETAHMVNFYQRSITRGYEHDTWLEETSAMMTEDIIAPTIIKNADGSGYNKIATTRLPGYLGTGGAVSYINWPDLSSSNYHMGGAFGAFLNRRYGLALYKQLVTACVDGTATTTSYGCLDSLIKTNGGVGFADEFTRFGASMFGTLPAVGAPAGYGFPAVTSLGYTLMPIDVASMVSLLPVSPSPLTSGFTATTHSYVRGTLAAGVTTYSRRNIVVPANTSVSVVVK